MSNDERARTTRTVHNVIMEERSKLTISGVEDVASFDEGEIVLQTGLGTLIIRGTGLHVERLSLESGELKVEGHVSDLIYEEIRQSGSLWSKLFK